MKYGILTLFMLMLIPGCACMRKDSHKKDKKHMKKSGAAKKRDQKPVRFVPQRHPQYRQEAPEQSRRYYQEQVEPMMDMQEGMDMEEEMGMHEPMY